MQVTTAGRQHNTEAASQCEPRLFAQAPPDEASGVAAVVESIEHAIAGAVHSMPPTPVPLPMTAAAMGVVPSAPAGPAVQAAGQSRVAVAAAGVVGDRALAKADEQAVLIEAVQWRVRITEGGVPCKILQC